MGAPEGVAGRFDRVADTYDRVGVPWFVPIAAGLVRELAARPGERVLDVGCGRGAALVPLAEAVGSTGYALGIDLAPRMVELTARDLADVPQVEVRVGDARAPAIDPATFDVVASSLVLFFLPDPTSALRAWSGLLVPGGRLGVTTFGTQDERWRGLDSLFDPYIPQAMLDARTSGRRGPFASDAGVEDLFVAAGLTAVRTVTEQVGARFRDAEHFLQFSWSHGQRALWGSGPGGRTRRSPRTDRRRPGAGCATRTAASPWGSRSGTRWVSGRDGRHRPGGVRGRASPPVRHRLPDARQRRGGRGRGAGRLAALGGTDRSVVRNPAAFLTTTTTRLAINAATSAHARRETYIGPWLPEPVDTAADPALGAERTEALEMAVLLLLEKLGPTERAAYVLREAFAYSSPGRSPRCWASPRRTPGRSPGGLASTWTPLGRRPHRRRPTAVCWSRCGRRPGRRPRGARAAPRRRCRGPPRRRWRGPRLPRRAGGGRAHDDAARQRAAQVLAGLDPADRRRERGHGPPGDLARRTPQALVALDVTDRGIEHVYIVTSPSKLRQFARTA